MGRAPPYREYFLVIFTHHQLKYPVILDVDFCSTRIPLSETSDVQLFFSGDKYTNMGLLEKWRESGKKTNSAASVKALYGRD